MAADRFKQYQYALVRFFRSRGYDVNSIKKTIKIDAYDLTYKETQRLKQLENWGFNIINPNEPYKENTFTYVDLAKGDDYYSESFIDFADEIIWLCKNDL